VWYRRGVGARYKACGGRTQLAVGPASVGASEVCGLGSLNFILHSIGYKFMFLKEIRSLYVFW
jgi:hypothetical protein